MDRFFDRGQADLPGREMHGLEPRTSEPRGRHAPPDPRPDDAPVAGWSVTIQRLGILCMILLCLFFAGIFASMATAASPPGAPAAVWAIGLPNGYVIMEYQAQAVHVTVEDAARGIVEVRGGSRLVINTHASSRYAVNFVNRSTAFRPTGIDGMGDIADLGPKGGSVTQQAAAGRHTIALDYRFALAPGTPPGTYPWPLVLTVRGVVAGHGGQVVPDSSDVVLSGQAEP